MKRLVALSLAAMFVSACGDHKTTAVAAAPQMEVKPPAVEAPPVALPPLPSVNATDSTAAAAPEKPTPVDANGAPRAIDSPATDPKGTLSKAEEANSMPQAGHGNNHSSPSLESSPQK